MACPVSLVFRLAGAKGNITETKNLVAPLQAIAFQSISEYYLAPTELFLR